MPATSVGSLENAGKPQAWVSLGEPHHSNGAFGASWRRPAPVLASGLHNRSKSGGRRQEPGRKANNSDVWRDQASTSLPDAKRQQAMERHKGGAATRSEPVGPRDRSSSFMKRLAVHKEAGIIARAKDGAGCGLSARHSTEAGRGRPGSIGMCIAGTGSALRPAAPRSASRKSSGANRYTSSCGPGAH